MKLEERINEARQERAEEYRFDQEKKVREYRLAMSGHEAALEKELAGLKDVDGIVRPACSDIVARFSESPFDPPGLRRIVGNLLSRARGTLNMLNDNPKQIEKCLNLIRNRKPADFIDTLPATLADIDFTQVRPLLDRVRGLEAVPGELAGLEQELERTPLASPRPYRPLPGIVPDKGEEEGAGERIEPPQRASDSVEVVRSVRRPRRRDE